MAACSACSLGTTSATLPRSHSMLKVISPVSGVCMGAAHRLSPMLNGWQSLKWQMASVLNGLLPRLRLLKLYYDVPSSHLPARQVVRVLKFYKVASSHLPAPSYSAYYSCTESCQFSSSSSPDTRAHGTSRPLACFSRSAEGCARMGQIALSPAFRALDPHDLRRGLRAHGANRTLAGISHTRPARSLPRVARTRDKSHSRLRSRTRHARSSQRVARTGDKSHLDGLWSC